MTANKMPEMPKPFIDLLVPVVREAWEEQMHSTYNAGYLAGIAAARDENAKLREMLADCTAYVAARDDYDREADKYRHESNRGPMLKVRAAVLAAVKKYRIVLANLSALEQGVGK